MNIFEKLFGKRKKEEEKPKNECWYNNAHENGEALGDPLENANSGTGASLDHAIVNGMTGAQFK